MSWDENNLVIIETSSQILVLLVVPLQGPDTLKLVCSPPPQINVIVFLDNGKRISLAYQLYATIISKVQLGSATGSSVETVTLFPCTEQAICVHKETNKQNPKCQNSKFSVLSNKDGASNFGATSRHNTFT